MKSLSLAVSILLAAAPATWAQSTEGLVVYNPQVPGQSPESILKEPLRDNLLVRTIKSMPTPGCTSGYEAPALWNSFWNDSRIDMVAVASVTKKPSPSNTPAPTASGDSDTVPRLGVVHFQGAVLPARPSDPGHVVPISDLSGQTVYVPYGTYEELWQRKLAGLALGTVRVGGQEIDQRKFPLAVRLYAACKFKNELTKDRQFQAAQLISAEEEAQSWGQVALALNLINGLTMIGPTMSLAAGATLLVRKALVKRAVLALTKAGAEDAEAYSIDIAVTRVMPKELGGWVRIVGAKGGGKLFTSFLPLEDALQIGMTGRTPLRLPMNLFARGASGEVVIGAADRSLLQDFMEGRLENGLLNGGGKLDAFEKAIPEKQRELIPTEPGVSSYYRQVAPGLYETEYRAGASQVAKKMVYGPPLTDAQMSSLAAKAIRESVASGKGGTFKIKLTASGTTYDVPITVEYSGGQVRAVALGTEEVAARAAGNSTSIAQLRQQAEEVIRSGNGVVYKVASGDGALAVKLVGTPSEAAAENELLRAVHDQFPRMDGFRVLEPANAPVIVDARGPVPTIASRWVDGQPLGKFLASGRELTAADRVALRRGIERLHQMGYAHADLSADNFMVTVGADQRKTFTLLDLGSMTKAPAADFEAAVAKDLKFLRDHVDAPAAAAPPVAATGEESFDLMLARVRAMKGFEYQQLDDAATLSLRAAARFRAKHPGLKEILSLLKPENADALEAALQGSGLAPEELRFVTLQTARKSLSLDAAARSEAEAEYLEAQKALRSRLKVEHLDSPFLKMTPGQLQFWGATVDASGELASKPWLAEALTRAEPFTRVQAEALVRSVAPAPQEYSALVAQVKKILMQGDPHAADGVRHAGMHMFFSKEGFNETSRKAFMSL